jgi:membrane protease YdiL (CAAX protease family)
MDVPDRSAGANDGSMLSAVLWQRSTAISSIILWTYLVLVTVAELLTSLGPPQAGLVLHTVILIGLIANTVFGFDEAGRRLALALTLAPLIRILSLGMPLRAVPQVAWYPLVSVPLLIATWIIIRQTGVSRQSLGLRRGSLVQQILLIGSGFGLGASEYAILRPESIVPSLTLQALALPMLSLLIFTGFTEEIIFRGLLQSLAIPVLGRWALTYVALLFGVLHIGYLSFWDVVFVFTVGFIFAYLMHWGGSLLGLTLAHGLTNIMLFLVLPYLYEHPDHLATRLIPWIVGLGSALSLVAAYRIWQDAHLDYGTELSIDDHLAEDATTARIEDTAP